MKLSSQLVLSSLAVFVLTACSGGANQRRQAKDDFEYLNSQIWVSGMSHRVHSLSFTLTTRSLRVTTLVVSVKMSTFVHLNKS